MGVADLCLVSDDAEDMGLTILRVDRVAHALAVNGQALVGFGHLCVPALQRTIELVGVDACKHIADTGMAGDFLAAVAVATATAKARAGLLVEVLHPGGNDLVAACPTQHRRRDGQHEGQWMAPALAAARLGNLGEECQQRTHLCATSSRPRA